MIGYGAEDNHFVVELTYNYGLGSYAMGNDFQGITIKSPSVAKKVADMEGCVKSEKYTTIKTPGGYKFHIIDEEKSGDPVVKVTLASSDITKSHDYWVGLLGMKCYEKSDDKLVVGYSDEQAKLELIKVEGPVDHAKAFGRIAFSLDRSELPALEKQMKENNQTILTPLVSLDTPGKSTVEVVILADPDGHEICFVGDGAFRELSQVDPKANDLLAKAMAEDKSDEWYLKKGKTKQEA